MTGPIGGGGPISPLPGSPYPETASSASPLLIPGMLILSQDSQGPQTTRNASIPIIEFARAVQETINKLKEQLSKDAYQDNVQSTRFHQVIINRALFLRELLLNAMEAVELQKNLLPLRNQQVRDVNQQIDAYNIGVVQNYFASYSDLVAVRALYDGILNFVDPLSIHYQDENYIQQKIDDYGDYTGADMSSLIDAVDDFVDPGPFHEDWGGSR